MLVYLNMGYYEDLSVAKNASQDEIKKGIPQVGYETSS